MPFEPKPFPLHITWDRTPVLAAAPRPESADSYIVYRLHPEADAALAQVYTGQLGRQRLASSRALELLGDLVKVAHVPSSRPRTLELLTDLEYTFAPAMPDQGWVESFSSSQVMLRYPTAHPVAQALAAALSTSLLRPEPAATD